VSDEETRAAEWRASTRRRAQAALLRSRQLQGSPSARKRLLEQWQPVIDAAIERKHAES
jgi:hypothetical protein